MRRLGIVHKRTEHRELLAGEKQRKGFVELASEHLPEIFIYYIRE